MSSKTTPKSSAGKYRPRSKKKRRRDPLLIGEFKPELAEEPVHARLYADDDEYLRAKLTTGQKQSELVRDYVRKAIEAERLRRAARDPYVGKLIELLDTTIARHTAKLERRLSMEFLTLRRFVATTIVLSNLAYGILETYVAAQPPPDDLTLAERRKSFFGALKQRYIKEAEDIMDRALVDRDDVLAKLFEKGLVTGVQDLDLDAAIKELADENQ